jgi:glutamate-1-semialdehyde 2,1-aminomutase
MTESIATTIVDHYRRRTPRSSSHDEAAKRALPGGDTRWATYYQPYPAYMERGEGCFLFDADGNRYIDFLNNYTALVLGHAHPPVVQAAQAQMTHGAIFGAPAAVQYQLAELICERMPGVDFLRYTNSGTEATMMAMRAARAFTGRDVILKMDGGYHGTHDFAEVNITPDPNPQGQPAARVEKGGIPVCTLDGVMVARFNDLASTEAILEEHHARIAGLIVEPVQNTAGMVVADEAFLRGLRKLADKYGVLLIFDEVVTFRLSTGGMQKITGVIPDLTALGKSIGGGYAIGAFGGKAEVMAHYDPAHPQNFQHSGTFNGQNVAMAAGLATLQNFGPEEIDRMNALGSRLREGFLRAFRAAGIKGQVTGLGSLLYVHWSEHPIRTPTDVLLWKRRAAELPRLLHLELLNRGIFSANRGMFNTSAPMTEREIDECIAAFGGALEMLKPYAAEHAPHLLG